eukprot:668936-Amphidinium_carterae.3
MDADPLGCRSRLLLLHMTPLAAKPRTRIKSQSNWRPSDTNLKKQHPPTSSIKVSKGIEAGTGQCHTMCASH